MADTPRRIHVNGVDLMVSVTGRGIPLIWGHGLMGSMASEDMAGWFGWERLADQAQVIRYDARGHGTSGVSEHPSDYIWPRLADDMLALADQLGVERFVAGGQSMGCSTALYAALAAPERMRGLILATPPTAWETRAAQSAMYGQMAALVDSQGTAGLAAMVAQQPAAIVPQLILDSVPDIGAQMSRMIGNYNAHALSLVLRGAQQTNFPPREQIRTIAIPTLILAWVGDRSHPVATTTELQQLLPNARAHIAETLAEVWTWPQLMRDFLAQL